LGVWARAAAVGLSLALAGCAVGPNFEPPAPPATKAYTAASLPARTAATPGPGGVAQQFVQGLDVSGRWWELYRSPALNALVERALQANPDLQSAQAGLRAAREAYYAQRGALWPTFGAGYTLTRQKVSETVASPLASNAELYSLHTALLNIAYAPDVFGGLRRQVETAQAQAEAQKFQTEAAYLTLITNLLAAAVQEAMLREQIAATQASIDAQAEVVQVMRSQFAHGQVARGDMAAQAATLAQLRQTLPPLEKQRAQQADLVAVLTGVPPAEVSDDGVRLSDLALPTNLPVSLPASLVAQRPDIRAAEASLHAASAQVGVAVAARLPSFTLTVNGGGAATQFARMFSDSHGTWLLAGDVTQPIFEGGALLHRQRGAEAARDQAQAQYRSTVLSAFQNVADTLQALQSDAAALHAAAAAEQSAEESLAIARSQFGQGEVSRLALLNATQTFQQARIGRIQAQAARYADTAALFQALGGGWWNRSDAPPPLSVRVDLR
jgi:NodT family efflux transporter outer membrane factor (OMF) lipoprotein